MRSFVLVAECLNFTKAAERLYISQSTLSKHIIELEEQLGVQLFVRNHHSVRLTPAGFTLQQEAGSLFAKIDDVFSRTRKSQTDIWGKLRIGCTGIECTFLPKILEHFTALYPHVALDIGILTVPEINDNLERQELDIAFTPHLSNNLKSKFAIREVRRARLCFLLPRSHPYANRYSIDLAELKEERFILLSPATFPHGVDWFMQQCDMQGFTPHIVSQPSRFETLFWQVLAGMGISFWSFDPVFCRMMQPNMAFVAMKGANAYGNIAVIWKSSNPNPVIPLFIKEFDAVPLTEKLPMNALR
ncbi:LysR family transcriptional regulator [Acetonema longum]|uniref:LysR substrate-binding domain-containing protein n=1 Tax=Acetonema longum TaxID=2374 RepID=UPI00145E3E44|nr:LysR family transcriptional regulator [Acetonema longum]